MKTMLFPVMWIWFCIIKIGSGTGSVWRDTNPDPGQIPVFMEYPNAVSVFWTLRFVSNYKNSRIRSRHNICVAKTVLRSRKFFDEPE